MTEGKHLISWKPAAQQSGPPECGLNEPQTCSILVQVDHSSDLQFVLANIHLGVQ
jgi:hypothetical protein